MAEKQSNKDRLKEITNSIENGIKELFESEKYKNYLRTMSRFHKYSVNNTMLIYMQKPDATVVAGFNKWRDQFGRNVLKGEKGIKIIAPTPYKKKIEEAKLDPDTKLPMLDADGKAIMARAKQSRSWRNSPRPARPFLFWSWHRPSSAKTRKSAVPSSRCAEKNPAKSPPSLRS